MEALNLFSAGALLFFSIFLMTKPRLPAMLRHFGVSCVFLGALLGLGALDRGEWHGWLLAAWTVLFKGLLIPIVLLSLARNTRASMQLRFNTRPAMTYLLIALALLVSAFTAARFPVEISGGSALFALSLWYSWGWCS